MSHTAWHTGGPTCGAANSRRAGNPVGALEGNTECVGTTRLSASPPPIHPLAAHKIPRLPMMK